MMKRRSIALIPAYNAEYTIAKVILLAKNYVDFVYVYDDGSTDMTNIMAQLTNVFIMGDEKNRGKGHALKELFNWALEKNPDWVVTIDADDQHDPTDIPKLAEFIENGECDIAIGRRDGQSIFRRIGNKILNLLSPQNIDMQSGFRVYSRKALREISFKNMGFGSDQEILENLIEKNFVVKEVEISSRYNKHSHSKNPIAHFIEVMKSIFFRKSLSTFGLAGLALIFVGLQLIVQVIISWTKYRQLAVGTLILGEFSVMVGMLTFFTGLILHLVQKRIWD